VDGEDCDVAEAEPSVDNGVLPAAGFVGDVDFGLFNPS